MKKFQVSVIIPVYNTLKYLKRCIDSLIHQTIQSVEIIVVDDNSTEDIRIFIQEEYPNNKNIKYFRNNIRRGPGGARNIGLSEANGDFICFCDSDDWLDLNTFEKAVNIMEDEVADIGLISMIRESNYLKSNTNTNFNCIYKQLYHLNSDMAIRILSNQYSTEININPACINRIFRKRFLLSVQAAFEENIYFQGILFMIYVFLRTDNIICIPGVRYHHLNRKDSVVQSFDKKHLDDYKICFKKMKKYFLDADSYEKYRYNYYKLCEKYMNLIISEIFIYIQKEDMQKEFLRKLLLDFQSLIDVDEYFSFLSAEDIRQHIQPYISNPYTVLN